MKIKIQYENSPETKHLMANDYKLAKAIPLIGDLTYQTHQNTEMFFFETIIGQMLSNKVADIITERFYHLCKGEISAQNVQKLSVDSLREIGISTQKSNYILGFAAYIKENPEFLNTLVTLDNDAIIKRLISLRGIGSWTAKMYLIFVLDRRDILPYEDGAFIQAFKWLYPNTELSVKFITETCASWKPYTSIGARYLYKLLDSGYTKSPLI